MRLVKRGAVVTPEERPIGDASKLMWAQFFGPMQQAAAHLNAAIQSAQSVVAGAIIKAEGLSPDEWQFNMDTLKLVRRPPAK